MLRPQLRHEGILCGAIRLRVVRLAECHHELFLAAPAPAAAGTDGETCQRQLDAGHRDLRSRCTATASTIITALIIISTLLSTFFSRSILVRMPMNSVPTMVPEIEPLPPERRVPPITTAAMASSSYAT